MAKRIFYSQTQYPYSACSVIESFTNTAQSTLTQPLADRTLFDQVVKTGYAYTKDTCLNFCLQTLIFKHCRCITAIIAYNLSSSSNPYGTDDYCQSHTDLVCAHQVMINSSISPDMIEQNCSPLCPMGNIFLFLTRL